MAAEVQMEADDDLASPPAKRARTDSDDHDHVPNAQAVPSEEVQAEQV